MYYQKDIIVRCRVFATAIIKLANGIPEKQIVFTIGKQIIDVACSVGANMVEARLSRSAKEFLSCAGISLKEINETMYWLDLLNDSSLISKKVYAKFYTEAKQIAKIIRVIIINYRKSSNLNS